MSSYQNKMVDTHSTTETSEKSVNPSMNIVQNLTSQNHTNPNDDSKKGPACPGKCCLFLIGGIFRWISASN